MASPGAQVLTAFSNPSSGSGFGRVRLEQEPWDTYQGYLTKSAMLRFMDVLLFGNPASYSAECAVNQEGAILGLINAYPWPKNLSYHPGITHGTLGPKIVDTVPYSEVLDIQLDTSPSLRYDTDDIASATWLGPVLNADLEPISPPQIDISGNTPVTVPAIGKMKVKYNLVRHRYAINMLPRLNAEENKYQAHFYAVWDGGNSVVEFNPPDEVGVDGRCNGFAGPNYGELSVTKKPYAPPTVQPEDVTKYWDYCRNEELI